MTTATIDFDQPTLFKEGRFTRDSPPSPAPRSEPPVAPTPSERAGDRLTLDDVLSAAWDGLAAHHSVTCPVCSGSMAPRYGSGAAPVGGRCKRCGSTLG
jgi:hypothetical protein